MADMHFTAEEITQRGEELYERSIRAQVEGKTRAKYLVLDIETGDCEIGDDYLALSDQILAKRPEAMLYAKRIGSSVLGRMGGKLVIGAPRGRAR